MHNIRSNFYFKFRIYKTITEKTIAILIFVSGLVHPLYVQGGYKEDDVEEEGVEVLVPKKVYTARKKLEHITKTIEFSEIEASINESVLSTLEVFRRQYYQEAFSKQSKVTSYFLPSSQ